MIKVKNKKTHKELLESAKEFREGVLKDKKELQDFQDSNFFSSVAEIIFWIVILILDGYLIITGKLSWIILFIITAAIFLVYYFYKKKK